MTLLAPNDDIDMTSFPRHMLGWEAVPQIMGWDINRPLGSRVTKVIPHGRSPHISPLLRAGEG